jgi:hypothetical protein
MPVFHPRESGDPGFRFAKNFGAKGALGVD